MLVQLKKFSSLFQFDLFIINEIFKLSGTEGLEPPNVGTKNRSLTTWRCPNLYNPSLLYKFSIIIGFLV